MFKADKVDDLPGPGAYNGNEKVLRESSPGFRYDNSSINVQLVSGSSLKNSKAMLQVQGHTMLKILK